MNLLFLSTVLATAWSVEAGVVDLAASRLVRRAHTSFRTTADLPTQTGIPSNCNKFYDIVSGDTCATVEAAFGITSAQFLAWNVGLLDSNPGYRVLTENFSLPFLAIAK
jgi:hypothetical protein